MAPASSPLPFSFDNGQTIDELDEDIRNVHAQIHELTKRRKLLSNTLLNSTAVQKQLKSQPQISSSLSESLTPLLEKFSQHSQSNTHRLAFGVTGFPFTDPSPDTSDERLLGIRIDICGRDGKYKDPHYVLCKRVNDGSSEMQVHKHTIPSFIPLKDYQDKYLPVVDDEYESRGSVDVIPGKQDLHEFVRKVRHDLVSWNLRREAVDLLSEQLGLSSNDDGGDEDMETETRGKFGVRKIETVEVEARYARIEWQDGRLGRVKIADDGMIERAVVFGEAGRRLKKLERQLTEPQVNVMDFVKRLEALDQENGDE